ncbi:PTS sugar transporter subunit IIB [Amphibacillus sp. Q70]|uniref:PTS sugar transporter subunit IIB n=1 Tax=Amphibacillus sp. Q70 TaxID=3453416 RepID=UPI003F83A203
MTKVKTILCCCISGLGSSFIVEMNVKKALQELGKNEIKVTHAGINDAITGAADLFVCSADVYDTCSKAGDAVSLDRLTDYNEVLLKLKNYFEADTER